ncbi:extra-large guanine nucleotide-binding protein 1-like [Senna tora]|uniref:Extra-large guanine nucleotide-binding protein 1-like n=1 Tax=Senna tora TaxID=362788 RepID=A0A835CFI9_9FABA|nr:extra-large guanine nucleotide-binding protein 1-like [Senna tora]
MAWVLRKWLPHRVPSVSEDDTGDNHHDFEFSIAMLYNGPAIDYSIPEIPPFKIDQIPLASVASISCDDQLAVPIIQPINVKPNRTNRAGNDDDDDEEYRCLRSEKIPTNSVTTESGSSSRSVSAEISSSCSCGQGDCNNVSPKHVKRPSVVTFESNDVVVVSEKSDDSQAGIRYPVKPKVERTGKRGTCHRCHKGNRFTEKEICIVCDAKYCSNCLLRAMGCMSEGRKCVTCTRFQINESNRGKLGKCSSMLKQLLSPWQVKQIMHVERFCEANQIPAELVCVNGDSLDRKKMKLLLSCPNPPKKLEPGFYWYDKASGLWGKDGKGPSQIISAQLDVGGALQEKASNGNTNVYINRREITKEELLMLKVAGVPCEGKPSFWVDADGSYRYEGQNSIKGRIWDKMGAKVVCVLLSLPRPTNSLTPRSEGETGNVVQDNLETKMHKFLLVGSTKSGTSTIFKQAKLQYDIPFSENDRQNIKLVIQSNLYTYLGILLEAREGFEEESLLQNRKRRLVNDSTSSDNTGKIIETTIYSIGPRLKAFSDLLINYMVSGNFHEIFPAATHEPLVEELWSDAAIQATYNRRDELEMLPRNASYFLARAVEICKTDYEPSDMDILYSEGITISNSLASMEFSFPESGDEGSLYPEFQHDPSLRYQLIRLHPRSLGENCKWLEMFEDIDVVLFCVALTDYDEYTIDSSNGVSTNKMLAAKQLFENMITHPTFKDKKFLLLLNKFDLLEEKIELVPLTQCEWFYDFNPVISYNQSISCTSNHSNNTPLAYRAFQYIAVKFKRLFHSLTNRKLFVSWVTGLESDTVDEALRYAREIMVWDASSFTMEKSEFTSTDSETEEASSS